jgi:hypothetical protein
VTADGELTDDEPPEHRDHFNHPNPADPSKARIGTATTRRRLDRGHGGYGGDPTGDSTSKTRLQSGSG